LIEWQLKVKMGGLIGPALAGVFDLMADKSKNG
jgi:hypothetical protein